MDVIQENKNHWDNLKAQAQQIKQIQSFYQSAYYDGGNIPQTYDSPEERWVHVTLTSKPELDDTDEVATIEDAVRVLNRHFPDEQLEDDTYIDYGVDGLDDESVTGTVWTYKLVGFTPEELQLISENVKTHPYYVAEIWDEQY